MVVFLCILKLISTFAVGSLGSPPEAVAIGDFTRERFTDRRRRKSGATIRYMVGVADFADAFGFRDSYIDRRSEERHS